MGSTTDPPRRHVPDETIRDSPSGMPSGATVLHGLAYIGDSETPGHDTARLIWFSDAERVVIERGPEFAVQSSEGTMRIEVPDGHASKPHAHIERTPAGWHLHDERSKNGTYVGNQRVKERALLPGDVLVTGRSFWRYLEHVSTQIGVLPDEPSVEVWPTRTICPALIESLALLRLTAQNRNPLLLLGESGSGKELLARQIHKWSRRTGEFRAINCPSLAQSLVESELFGHMKGAFTGAHSDHVGHIETAAGGTLLLDEIGELSNDVQTKLLRVLGEGELIRVQDTRVRRVDVRFIAATSQPDVTLRKDLLGRFDRSFPPMPPLRSRPEDIGILVAHFLREHDPERANALRAEPEFYRRLITYSWPDNIRELKRALQRALMVAASSPVLRSVHLQLAAEHAAAPQPLKPPRPSCDELALTLQQRKWNISAVAKLWDVQPTQIYRWMEKCGLERPK